MEVWCGYCGKFLGDTYEVMIKHIHNCEVDCCNKHYGELNGNTENK